MELGIDPYAELDVVDYGDVEVRSSNLAHNHAGLQTRVGEILSAGAVAVVLGGDHSLSTPVLAALAGQFGTDGFSVIHFDTHADTGLDLEESPHGIPFSKAVLDGHLDGHNIVQVGLRGAWPFPDEFEWMREQGFRWHTMGEVDRARASARSCRMRSSTRGRARPRTYLTVDIDVLDPAFAPGTGTAEPGGLMTRELLWAVRTDRVLGRPLRDGHRRGLAAVRPRWHHRDGRPPRRARDAGRHRAAQDRPRGAAGAPVTKPERVSEKAGRCTHQLDVWPGPSSPLSARSMSPD